MQFSVEEGGCYIYCGTDSGDIVKLVVTVGGDGVRESVGLQVQTCAVMRTGRGGGGGKDVNAGKFAGGASGFVECGLVGKWGEQLRTILQYLLA